MSKAVKAMITEELKERYADVNSACVVDLTGLNVQQQEQLRRSLRERDSRLEVVKNSLARCAFAGTELQPLGEVLAGPCALVTTKGSPIDAAKVLVEAAKEFTELQLKQAMIEGDPNLVTVEALAKMLGRAELLGRLATLIGSTGRTLAACVASPQAKIAGCIKVLAERDSE
jgi:large subunit ribosomal protein L10